MAGRPVFTWVKYALPWLDVKVRAASRTVSDGAALNLRKHAAQNWIIVANHHHAVKRNAIHEVEKSAFDVAHVAIAVHVLAINICDHGENGRELEKRTIALIGLCYKI